MRRPHITLAAVVVWIAVLAAPVVAGQESTVLRPGGVFDGESLHAGWVVVVADRGHVHVGVVVDDVDLGFFAGPDKTYPNCLCFFAKNLW